MQDNRKLSPLKISLKKESTLFDALEKAALQNDNDWKYEWRTWENVTGVYITSIGGLKEDVIKHNYWMFYEVLKDTVDEPVSYILFPAQQCKLLNFTKCRKIFLLIL